MHLLLERGQPPTESVHAPLTPQCTPPSASNNQDQTKSKEQPQEVKEKPEYSFVTEGEATEWYTIRKSQTPKYKGYPFTLVCH